MSADSFRRRAWGAALFALMLPLLVLPWTVGAAETVFLDERFESLERWQPLTFPKIPRHSTYTLARCESANCLRMESNNSASALVLKQPFNVYEYPMLTWRWKVSNVYRKGDSGSKEGDGKGIPEGEAREADPESATS